MNLNKYTKAELISKIKEIKGISKNSEFNITTILFTFKKLILKFTLIALIVKIFRKYSIFRRIWTIFNTIIMSIFGISFMDIYGIEYFTNLLDFFRNTYLYSWFSGLLGNNIETVKEIPSRLKPINKNSTGNEESSTMIERIKQIVHKEPEEIVEDTPFYKDKNTYLILLAILILSGLSWYYWDDLQTIPGEIIEKLQNWRRKPGDDSMSPGGNLPNNSSENNSWNITERIKGWWNKDKSDINNDGNNPAHWTTPSNTPDSPNIELIDKYFPSSDKGKAVEPTEWSAEWNKKLISQISGNSLIKFKEDSDNIIEMIDHFQVETFPNIEIKKAIYNTIRGKLLALSATSPALYMKLIHNFTNSRKIQNFIDIENDLFPTINSYDPFEEVTQNNNNSEITQAITQNNNYSEVTQATAQEQEVWSDRASTPGVLSPKIFSPKPLTNIGVINAETNVVETNIEQPKLEDTKIDLPILIETKEETKKIDSLASGIKSIIEKVKDFANNPDDMEMKSYKITNLLDDSEMITDLTENINEKIELDINKDKTVEIQEEIINNTPKIIVKSKSNSSDSSDSMGSYAMDQFFKETDKLNVQDNTIKQDTKMSPVLSQINLKTDEFVQGSSKDNKLSPILSQINLKTEQFVEGSSNDIKPNRANLLAEINSKRIEYGTPVLKPLDLANVSPNLHNKLDSANKLFNDDNKSENNSEISEDQYLDKVEVNYFNEEKHKRFIEIDLGEHKKNISKFLFITNDGRSQFFNPEQYGENFLIKKAYKWDNLGITNPDYNQLELYKVIAITKNNDSFVLFKNNNMKFLKSFSENISHK